MNSAYRRLKDKLVRIITDADIVSYLHRSNILYRGGRLLRTRLGLSQDSIIIWIYGVLNYAYLNRTCKTAVRQIVSKTGKYVGESDARVKFHPAFIDQPALALSQWNQFRISKEFHTSREVRKNVVLESKHPINLVFVSLDNWNFMAGIIDSFQNNPQFAVTKVQLDRHPEIFVRNPGRLFFPGMDGRRTNYFESVVQSFLDLSPLIKADVVFVEWCNAAAVWMSHYLPRTKKLVIRLHSYEAYSHWIQFVNWSRVDHIVFIADHIRLFVDEQVCFRKFPRMKVSVVKNFNDLTIFDCPKNAGARKSIGMVGYNNKNKNPLHAVKLLAEILKIDPEWKLFFVGKPMEENAGASPLESAYFQELSNMCERYAENIVYRPFNVAVQEEFVDFGYILSASDREGSHESVVQGMASGCIPLVRRWPLCEKWKASKKVFPDAIELKDGDAIAETAAELVAIANSDRFESLSRFYKDIAMKRYDKGETISGLQRAIFD